MTQKHPSEWDLAGLTDQEGEGRLDRPLVAREITVPSEARIRNGRIEYVFRPPREWVIPGPRLLTTFVRLVDASERYILEYVRKWGALGLCKHDWPYIHNWFDAAMRGEKACRVRFYDDESAADVESEEVEPYANWIWEPVAAWRKWSSDARTVLDLAAKVHTNELVTRDTWNTLVLQPITSDAVLHPFGFRLPELRRTLAGQRQVLASKVNVWLELGEVRPYLELHGSVLTVSVGGISLFGALAGQLLAAVNRTKSFSVCASCGKSYSPNRRKALGRRGYCKKCGLKAAWRDAQRNRRTLIAEVRRLREEGKSIKAIAQAVGRDAGMVKRCIVGARERRT
jgi:hypothetical protein